MLRVALAQEESFFNKHVSRMADITDFLNTPRLYLLFPRYSAQDEVALLRTRVTRFALPRARNSELLFPESFLRPSPVFSLGSPPSLDASLNS